MFYSKIKFPHRYSPPARGFNHQVSLGIASDIEDGGRGEPRNRRREVPSVAPITAGMRTTPVLNHASSAATHEESHDEDSVERGRDSSWYLLTKRILAIVDASGIIWRSILPVPLWLNYFVQGFGSDVFPVAYLCFKMMIASWQARSLCEMLANFVLGKLVRSFTSLYCIRIRYSLTSFTPSLLLYPHRNTDITLPRKNYQQMERRIAPYASKVFIVR